MYEERIKCSYKNCTNIHYTSHRHDGAEEWHRKAMYHSESLTGLIAHAKFENQKRQE